MPQQSLTISLNSASTPVAVKVPKTWAEPEPTPTEDDIPIGISWATGVKKYAWSRSSGHWPNPDGLTPIHHPKFKEPRYLNPDELLIWARWHNAQEQAREARTAPVLSAITPLRWKPRSQKALGLRAILSKGGDQEGNVQNGPWTFLSNPTVHALIQSPEQLDAVLDTTRLVALSQSTIKAMIEADLASDAGLFVRPCPVRPRHGFVDSRPVHSIQEIKDVLAEALAADEQAEVLLMPKVEAFASAIWTPTKLAYGPGHDGATSGRESWVMPLVPRVSRGDPSPLGIYPGDIRISEDEQPYIELLFKKAAMHAGGRVRYTRDSIIPVQMRGGPKVPATLDYIPERTEVAEVVHVNPDWDLLAWEQRMEQATPGTVAYHKGGNLASHFAIHCVLNKIPYLTTREPEVGEVLEPTGDQEPLDPEAVAYGIALGTAVKLNGLTWSGVMLVLNTLHNLTALQGRDGGVQLGVAAAIMHRVGASALFGEARHNPNDLRWRLIPLELKETDQLTLKGADAHEVQQITQSVKASKSNGNIGMTMFQARSVIYEYYSSRPFLVRERLQEVRDQFWDPASGWGGSMGGPAWGRCGDALLVLDETIRLAVQDPTTENVRRLGLALNVAVNQAHNGGWWLNKFVTPGAMDGAAHGFVGAVAASVPMLLHLRTTSYDAEIQAALEGWKEQRRATEQAVPLRAWDPLTQLTLSETEKMIPGDRCSFCDSVVPRGPTSSPAIYRVQHVKNYHYGVGYSEIAWKPVVKKEDKTANPVPPVDIEAYLAGKTPVVSIPAPEESDLDSDDEGKDDTTKCAAWGCVNSADPDLVDPDYCLEHQQSMATTAFCIQPGCLTVQMEGSDYCIYHAAMTKKVLASQHTTKQAMYEAALKYAAPKAPAGLKRGTPEKLTVPFGTLKEASTTIGGVKQVPIKFAQVKWSDGMLRVHWRGDGDPEKLVHPHLALIQASTALTVWFNKFVKEHDAAKGPKYWSMSLGTGHQEPKYYPLQVANDMDTKTAMFSFSVGSDNIALMEVQLPWAS